MARRTDDETPADPIADTYAAARQAQRSAMGAVIRTQRELANMSLRELARVTRVSNAYLSQLERGLHEPSMRVLGQIAEALRLPVQDFLHESDRPRRPGGGADGVDGADRADRRPVEDAIRADSVLTAAEKESLLTVYRSYRTLHESQ